jgi:hypothetical protein
MLRAQSRVPTLPLVRGSHASTLPSCVPQTTNWCTGFMAHRFTSEAAVTRGLRNWPCSKFSLYTSGLPNQMLILLIFQTDISLICSFIHQQNFQWHWKGYCKVKRHKMNMYGKMETNGHSNFSSILIFALKQWEYHDQPHTGHPVSRSNTKDTNWICLD